MSPFDDPHRGSIRIRGTRGWPVIHGVEPPHVPLSAADRNELARIAEVVDFRTAASQIFRQGDEASFVYLLVEGLVRTVHTNAEGERQVVAFHWPGDLFGLAEDGVHVSSAETIIPARVYRFPCARLEPFLLRNPRIEDGFLVKAIHDLRNAQRQLIVMGRMDVVHRVAMFLLDCAGHDEFFEAATGILALPMTQYDIADYIGTSAETVTRAITELARHSLVERIRPKRLRLDLAGLGTFAGFE